MGGGGWLCMEHNVKLVREVKNTRMSTTDKNGDGNFAAVRKSCGLLKL